MKKRDDPRHRERQQFVQQLFSDSFIPQNNYSDTTQSVLQHKEEIDSLIESAAPQWPIEKIAKTDLAILRLAVYELLIDATEPPKVVIDEAVELAKEFGGETSPSFINGVLGTLLKNNE